MSFGNEDLRTEQLAGETRARSAFAVRSANQADSSILVISPRSGVLTVGTSPSCELVVSDRSISRRHVSFSVTDGALRVTDLDSTNGTFLNGVRIKEAFAAPGDTIRIGASLFSVSEETADDPDERRTSFGGVVGTSAAMRRLYPILDKLVASSAPVLIEGATGTGKDLLAETLHERGARSAAPFVVFDVSVEPSDTCEVALFDTDDGAYSRARGGTLVIDDVNLLTVKAQLRLLTELKAAKGDSPRVITTSRVSLDKEVERGNVREDLFFALFPGRIELPLLSARGDDWRLLAEYFWKRLEPGTSVPPELLRRFEGHSWPGNVRELASAVARRALLGELDAAPGGTATSPERAFDWLLARDLPYPLARNLLIHEFERVFVAKALEEHGGNVSRAASASGLARRYFQIMRARAQPKG